MRIRRGHLYKLESFKEFINSLDLSEPEKEIIISELYSEKSVLKMSGSDSGMDTYSIQGFLSFIQFVSNKVQEYGIDYIKDAINYSFSYENDNCSFLDQFIKFIVITNFDEIRVVVEKGTGVENIYAYLGEFELSHNKSIQYSKENDEVEFEWFHNRPGLKRTKLGNLMMVYFFNWVINNYPTATVCANNVRRINVDAQAFYKKMGFRIIDSDINYKNVRVEINHDEMKECILNNQGKYPILLFNGKKYDFTTYKANQNSQIKNH